MSNKNILPPEPITNQAIAQRLKQEAYQRIQRGQLRKKNLVWLELTGCSGNIISLLNGTNPDFEFTMKSMVNFIYSNSLMAGEGEKAIEQLMNVLNEDFILAVEGAVATRNNGLYHIIGRWKGEPFTALQAAKMFGEKAYHVIAVGACATHGGPSAAKPNPAQCVGLPNVLERKMIKLPSCPCHPDWFLGTLAHLLLYGEPELDHQGRPVLFYSSLIHDKCPRRHFFDREIFATTLGESACLFKVGCRGPVTRIDCPTRQWNGYINWPIETSTCIGCTQFGFPDQMSPFVRFDQEKE